MTRLKVRCVERGEIDGGGGKVVLSPVTSGSEENKAFFKWTPGGRFEFNSINQAAVDQFAVGQEYFIDISPAVAPAPEFALTSAASTEEKAAA